MDSEGKLKFTEQFQDEIPILRGGRKMNFFRGLLYVLFGMFGLEWLKITHYLVEEGSNLTNSGLAEIMPLYHLVAICVILCTGFLSIKQDANVLTDESGGKDEV